jgi:hypothetical protein
MVIETQIGNPYVLALRHTAQSYKDELHKSIEKYERHLFKEGIKPDEDVQEQIRVTCSDDQEILLFGIDFFDFVKEERIRIWTDIEDLEQLLDYVLTSWLKSADIRTISA